MTQPGEPPCQHPEVRDEHPDNLRRVSPTTLERLLLAARRVAPPSRRTARRRPFVGQHGGKQYRLSTYEAGCHNTGLVADIAVRDIVDGRVGGYETTYRILCVSGYTLEKDDTSPQANPLNGLRVSADNPADVAAFQQWAEEFFRQRAAARAMGLLDVSEAEARSLIAALGRLVPASA